MLPLKKLKFAQNGISKNEGLVDVNDKLSMAIGGWAPRLESFFQVNIILLVDCTVQFPIIAGGILKLAKLYELN